MEGLVKHHSLLGLLTKGLTHPILLPLELILSPELSTMMEKLSSCRFGILLVSRGSEISHRLTIEELQAYF